MKGSIRVLQFHKFAKKDAGQRHWRPLAFYFGVCLFRLLSAACCYRHRLTNLPLCNLVSTHTSQSVQCPSVFDPQSPVCLTSVNTNGTLPWLWHGWKRCTSAQYSCMSTSRVTQHGHDLQQTGRTGLVFFSLQIPKPRVKQFWDHFYFAWAQQCIKAFTLLMWNE